MKRILNYKTLILMLGVLFSFTSCLKRGLDDLPAFDEAEIANIFFEHRYLDPDDEWIDGSEVVKNQRLEVAKEINGNEVDVIITVPEASGTFTEEERQNVSLSNIVCYMNISTAATIEPVDGAPVLGKPGDFSTSRKYKITAANGKTAQTWTIKITELVLN
ncbi:hypothetical protein INQ51_21755 [Maribellus sp. CM-23]|uniref:DUF5018-related domain-containing protein n=1 Tax=Maribellus sp. CM-23 TaxID=2781026 RepID=UPI001F396A58|nr:hypothetical protein [Maribellus sp. CM-23]MCE4566962.1 hypothetical protein [Maribellus sp. CM-23]